MTTHRLMRRTFGTFFKNWPAYVALIIILNLFLNSLMVPLMRWLTMLIMEFNGIPYITYTNVGWLLTAKPLATFELFLLAMLILALVFWQFAFLLQGIDRIRHARDRRLMHIALEAFKSLGHLHWQSFLFFIPYFILVLPFADLFFSSPLLAKVRIPTFIFESLQDNLPVMLLIAVLGLVITYIGLRFIQVLPLMVFQRQTGFEAAKTSWRLTHHRVWTYFWRLITLSMLAVTATATVSILLYVVQTFLDDSNKVVAFTGAVINMGLLNIWSQMVGAAVLVIFLLLLMLILEQQMPATVLTAPEPRSLPRTKGARRWATLLIVLLLGGQITYNVLYLQGALLTQPLTISHRGVDDNNGVQNTLPALIKTSKKKPDYVEMDIHETKDHQFVVMHDENLKNLTGVNKAPYQLTLRQLTRLTARENGHQAKVPSFDAYLATAEKQHQKLLVEIKTTPHDSKNMLQRFINRYQNRLLRDKDRIHSLDYQVVRGLRQRAPQLYVSFILPYNLTFPQTKAKAYTMEQSTLDDNFVAQAHSNQQAVYAWTVDDEDDMTRMLFLNVDAIITDNLTQLQGVIRDNFNQPSYASRLLIYSDDLSYVTNGETGALN